MGYIGDDENGVIYVLQDPTEVTLKDVIRNLDKQPEDINVLNLALKWLIYYNDWDPLTFTTDMLSFDLENISIKDGLPVFSYRCNYVFTSNQK